MIDQVVAQRIKELDKDRKSSIREAAREIAETLDLDTKEAERFIGAQRKGFKNPREYHDHLARRRGFDDFMAYKNFRKIQRAETGKREEKQKRFELGLENLPENYDSSLNTNNGSDNGDTRKRAEDLIDLLSNKKQAMVMRRIYLDGLSKKEVGEKMNMSREAVRQLEVKSLMSIRVELGIESDEIEEGERILMHILTKSEAYGGNSKRISQGINEIYHGGKQKTSQLRVKYFLGCSSKKKAAIRKYLPKGLH